MLAERIEELQQFQVRADALQQLGREALTSPLAEQQAIAAYRDLKGDIDARHKQQKRARYSGPETWFESVFENALRNAHIAMKSPTQTSPKNAKWVGSVLELRNEFSYHLKKLEKDLGQG